MKKENRRAATPIVEAIESVRQAQEHLAAVARERAAQELSTTTLVSLRRELESIVRRMSVYVEN